MRILKGLANRKEYTMPGSPQQNGRVERSLVNKVCAMVKFILEKQLMG